MEQLKPVRFHSLDYGKEVAEILALDGDGCRPLPLEMNVASKGARERLSAASPFRLFPRSPAPEAAMSGLYVYFSCFEEAHQIAQSVSSPEGSYWHGIIHRMEPDPGNAAYWFRQVGTHPIFDALARAAGNDGQWDPFVFIKLCEQALKQPGSPDETRARAVQLIEWQLLFDWCARDAP